MNMEGVCLIYKEAVKPADRRYKGPKGTEK